MHEFRQAKFARIRHPGAVKYHGPMTRLALLDDDQAGPADLLAAIRARRGGRLSHLDRMLLHSPPLAQGWNAHRGAVRTALALPARLREAVERSVLRLTLEMTRAVAVSDATFNSAQAALTSDRQLVELVGVIATYNMVSRFLVALQVAAE
jgi:alkylhydroperoxidase family enzyme